MKRKTAYKIAIDALREYQKRYAVGYNTYQKYGIFTWAKRDASKYIRISTAIKILEGFRDVCS